MTDDQLQMDCFINFATDIFIRMQPFNTFLNNALAAPAISTTMVFWYGEDEAHSRVRDLKWAKVYF